MEDRAAFRFQVSGFSKLEIRASLAQDDKESRGGYRGTEIQYCHLGAHDIPQCGRKRNSSTRSE